MTCDRAPSNRETGRLTYSEKFEQGKIGDIGDKLRGCYSQSQ